MEFAYVRVSTVKQEDHRQFISMEERGIPRERIFAEKVSGKNANRPKLKELLSVVQTGDTIVVEAISRFARNTKDLLNLVEQLADKGVEFVSLKEHIDTNSATGRFVLTLFGAVAELERGYLLQRQAEGTKAARARGVKFGRPIINPPENFGILVKEWECGNIKLKDILAQTKLKEATFYRRLREYRLTKKKK